MTSRPTVHPRTGRSRFRGIVANTGAGAGGEVADLGLRTVGSLLMARILGPAGLGSWLVARTVAFDLGSVLARCGLDEAALRFVARSHGRREPAYAPGSGPQRPALVPPDRGGGGGDAVRRRTRSRRSSVQKPEVAQLMRALAPSLLLWAPVVVLLAAVQGLDRVASAWRRRRSRFPVYRRSFFARFGLP